MHRKVLAIFETPTVFLLESTTPEVVSALGINPELELTILLRKDGVLYADKTKKVGSDRITAGEAWKSIKPLFKGEIYVVKEDVKRVGISPARIVSDLELINKKDVPRLIAKSDTVVVY
ncbi:MAG: hypothetical protein FJ358_02770 [Thaumarchaeota archaeon]|nr:hypothetical protein [Nitrososphaerota archaeon]